MNKLTKLQFIAQRRDSLLDYEVYEFNFEDRMEGFDIVRLSLSQSEAALSKFNPYQRMVPVKQRAWDGIEHLVNCYSAGHPIEEICAMYPAVVEYWKAYFIRFEIFLNWDENFNKELAALPLLGNEFQFANQLVSFAILLGYGGALPELRSLFSFNNIRRDGMIERLLTPYDASDSYIPAECTRHLPYFKTLKIFNAAASERVALMKEYLNDWYQASRREGYYDSHKRGDEFKGYWSWEAAAITYLLDIDDRSYSNVKFYPSDLVDFARKTHAPRSGNGLLAVEELRVKSGSLCPKSGLWETLDIPPQRREFEVGEIMKSEDANYGITVWRYKAVKKID